MDSVCGIYWKIPMHRSNAVLMWQNQVNRPVLSQSQEKKKDSKFLSLCILMDFPIYIDTISMELPIVHFKGDQR